MKLKDYIIAALATFAAQLVPVPYRFGQSGAVVTVKSADITNIDAVPARLVPAYTSNGRVREYSQITAFANGDSATSQYRMHRVRSNDRITEMTLNSDAGGAGAKIDVGLYDVNGGAAVSSALFASAFDNSGATVNVNMLVAQPTPANRNKRVWELLGLAADSQKEYDVVITCNVAFAAAGTQCLRTRVVQN